MKKLILLVFMLIANVFAGVIQEAVCDNVSLTHCITHYDKQCTANNYYVCGIVGFLHAEQEQYSKAKKYFEMACDKANSKDTFVIEFIDGSIVDNSIGAKVSMIEFIKSACGSLGRLYYNGWGVRQSYEKALHYYKKACDLGNGESCVFAGGAYYDGKSVQKDLKTALKFYTKSCELEYGLGCGLASEFYHYGIVVKQNYSKAKELYGRACDLGIQQGCDDYKKLKEKGY